MSSDADEFPLKKWLVRAAIGIGIAVFLVVVVLACGFAFLASRFAKLTPEQKQAVVLGAIQYGVTRGAERGFAIIDGQPSFVEANMAVGKRVEKINGADAESFRIFEHSERPRVFFAADKDRVYVASSFVPHVLPEADPETFEVLRPSGCWSRDARHVYFEQVAVPDADPQSFVALTDAYGRDANHAYLAVKKIPTADLASWEPLDDGTPGMFRSQHRKLPSIEQYEDTIAPSWSRDRDQIYDRTTPRDDLNPENFQILAHNYVKDDSQVIYFTNAPVANADPATFETAPELLVNPPPDARDKNGYFHRGKPWTVPAEANLGMTDEQRWEWRCNDAIKEYGTTEQRRAIEKQNEAKK